MKKQAITIGSIAVVLALLDQLTKWLALAYLQTSFNITSWFSLFYTENGGIAWSIPIPKEIIIPFSSLLLLIIIIGGLKYFNLTLKKSYIPVAMVIGGALGNIFDRLFRGYVIDFISVGWWPIFNLADILLTVGIFLIILFYDKIKRSN